MASKSPAKSGPKGKAAPKAKGGTELATAAATPLAAAEGPDVEALTTDAETDPAMVMNLRDLVTSVTATTGGKKKGVKEIVEATLTVLGNALAKGQELNLPGVGKVRVAKSVDRAGRSMLTLKVRGTTTPKPKQPKETLAEAGEAV